ncbi:MAG: bifunctional glutamate N-acetyltransferase/amino-acid acetyltransferase ArgJ [Candidatus Polarisedimenticolaceae bacterium]|nr:bifunctional glutamate N-acetyltransferase/amino-acid acetyltransferase ArgJ [Candidatus Polarisedimenticolaceae bacterium]
MKFIPIGGIRLATIAAGIRYQEREDLVLMELPKGNSCAAVFTQNAFCAAPVLVAREHLAATSPRYLLINSGNANAGTGEPGLLAARQSCSLLADAAGCDAEQILPFSTGVIGELLPIEPIQAALPSLVSQLDEANWPQAASAIMTTDTQAKLVSRQIEINGQMATVTGMAKGSGMICPNMATMLAYVVTDLAVTPELLQQALELAVAPSFNAITVDGDTSTNDACLLVAAGSSSLPKITNVDDVAFHALCEAVTEVCMVLARAIIKDGEGATKLVTILVDGAVDEVEARQVAYTVAHSPLVKTALFASDPNWGRILAAVGRAGVQDLVVERVGIWLDQVCIVRRGSRAEDYSESRGQAVMDQDEITIRIELGRGDVSSRILTCDLSHDYVTINAEYRT